MPEQERPVARIAYLVGVVLAAYLASAVVGIVLIRSGHPAFLSEDSLLRAHFMCGGFGFLGASLHAIRKYYQALISHSRPVPPTGVTIPNWSFGWVYYYLIRPFMGGILGSLVYMLSYVGLQLLANPKELLPSSQGTVLLYALALVAGYGVSPLLDRLEGIGRKIFKNGQRPGKMGAP